MLVADQLHFNVARPGEVLLNINLVATKECFCFALCAVHCFLHCFGVVHNFHAATAATKGSLDGNGITKVGAESLDFISSCDEFGGARNNRATAAQRCFTTRNLVAHFANCIAWGPDECHAHIGDGVSKIGVLTEESVTGVNSVGAALTNGIKNCLGVEVTLGCGLTT